MHTHPAFAPPVSTSISPYGGSLKSSSDGPLSTGMNNGFLVAAKPALTAIGSEMDSQRYQGRSRISDDPTLRSYSMRSYSNRSAISERHRSAEHALMQIEVRRKATEDQRRHEEEMNWIRENRRLYAGRWVALNGSDLLASGNTAKEVFQQSAGITKSTPLIIRIEAEALPFVGW